MKSGERYRVLNDKLADDKISSKKGKTFFELDTWLGKKNKVDVYTNVDIYKTVKKSRQR